MKKNFYPELDRMRRELRTHIEALGVDDAVFAARANIAANTLSLFLSGKTQVPKMDFLLRLIHFTDFRPWFMAGPGKPSAKLSDQGLPKDVTDAIQIASQMVDNFIETIPEGKRRKDPQKKSAFVAILADLQIAGQQEKIPELMSDVIAAFRVESPSL